MSNTVADVIISVFEKAGVKRCNWLPGDPVNHIDVAVTRLSLGQIEIQKIGIYK
jgi:thiamine pyrophosphate-dependent acetolactate synthase large subunit-like protein